MEISQWHAVSQVEKCEFVRSVIYYKILRTNSVIMGAVNEKVIYRGTSSQKFENPWCSIFLVIDHYSVCIMFNNNIQHFIFVWTVIWTPVFLVNRFDAAKKVRSLLNGDGGAEEVPLTKSVSVIPSKYCEEQDDTQMSQSLLKVKVRWFGFLFCLGEAHKTRMD